MKTCKIMRGVLGCGKSYYVEKHFKNAFVVSTDHFFICNGEYKFDVNKLKENHDKALRLFLALLYGDVDLIVVDNTNIHVWEIAPYYRLAEVFGYDVEIIHVNRDVETCKATNQHGVPASTIERMDQSMEALPHFWKQILVENS